MSSRTVIRLAAALACLAGATLIYLIPAPIAHPVRSTTPMPTAAPSTPASDSPTTDSPTSTPESSDSAEPAEPTADDLPTQPPSTVGAINLVSNTARTFTVSWDAARAEAGIKEYVVLVDGVAVSRQRSTEVTLRWPPGTETVLVQVAAIDKHGRQSDWRALAVIPPPQVSDPESPSPISTPTPTPSNASPSPAASSSPPVSPSPATSSPTPTATATDEGPATSGPEPPGERTSSPTPMEAP